ncbi:hypothetical protein LTS08_002324 [Lithohypha guttulata]|nr:hypothetical protein LTS08_002324 [Lithohypha guttulata]
MLKSVSQPLPYTSSPLKLALSGVPVPLLGWTPTCLIIIVGFVVGNNYFCTLLNGTERRFESYVDQSWKKHDDERWIFVNGVAAGSHWMQSNLDRLALTFRRPVHGIHNKTRGIIFDVIETIIQRTFGYATPDIREVYADVVKVIEDERDKTARYKKIVLILHSQGAVEGGLVLDWLFAAVSRELLQKLEVYTFGSAANHFNSPEFEDGTRVIQHIEHYANLGDYVGLFGILHFRPLPLKAHHQPGQVQEKIVNRYVGRLFARAGSGHQMNGNYLDNFFEMDLDKNGRPNKVKENNEYMDGVLNEELLEGYQIIGKVSERDVWDCGGQRERTERADGMARMIKDESRLWRYRNGMSPSK